MKRLRPQSEVLVIGELAAERQLLAAAEAGVSGYLASDAEGSLFEGLESLAHHRPYVPVNVTRRIVQAFADVAGVTRLREIEPGDQASGRDLATPKGDATANAAGPGH
jgi:DNA-binding NarL/FixJ family response regulator